MVAGVGMLSEVLIVDDDGPVVTALAGLAGSGVAVGTDLLSAGALVVALAFLVAGLAGVLVGEGSALSTFAVAELADLLAEADGFVTGSSFTKCVIHRQVS